MGSGALRLISFTCSCDFSAPLASLEFIPKSEAHLSPAFPFRDHAGGRGLILLTYPSRQFTNSQPNYTNALLNSTPRLVPNSHVDASYAHDLPALVGKDSSRYQSAAISISGSILKRLSRLANLGDSSIHGSLMILATIYNRVGRSDISRDIGMNP